MAAKWVPLVLAVVLLFFRDHGARAENVTLCWGDGSNGQLGNGQGDFNDLYNSYNSSMPVTVAGGHSFASVCSGFVHSCALEPSGKAWCWGYNHDDNAIDEPDTTSTTTPVEVPSNLTFRSITCGGYHTCALDDGGQAWCWGSNGDGQLGTNGYYFYEPEAAAIPWMDGGPVTAARHTFKALSAGALHTCGIAELGTAVCWGRSYDGQLGDNSTFVSEYGSTEPVDVAGGHTFRSIACGYSHTCALDDSGKAWCWGDGSVGQLGNGAAVDSMLPVPVLGNRTYVVIEVGEAHTCAITEAGAMWCWGRAMANGQTGYINEPAEVGGGHKLVAASSAGGFTCGLDVAGDVWCFGRNWIGQLGNGGYRSSTLPVKVASSHASFLALGQGTSNTLCAVSTKQASSGDEPPPPPSPSPSASAPPPFPSPRPTSAKNVTLCWGKDAFTQLGKGNATVVVLDDGSTFNEYNSSSPVQVSEDLLFAVVCSGSSHSCALDPGGNAWCWGGNDSGQLGTGSTPDSTTPVAVAGNHTFRSISCGGGHTCALDDTGRAWCWGAGGGGPLGTGNSSNSNVPVEAAAGRPFKALSAGLDHTCGIAELGRTICWGFNRFGLAPNQFGTKYVPVEVVGSQTFQSLSCGQYHCCALNDQGQALCWGRGYQQLGNDTQPAPVPVSGGHTFTSIDAGGGHTCAIDVDASLWCWGQSPSNGQSSNTGAPAKVDDNLNFAAVTTGYDFSCGLDTSGDIWCFGMNSNGELGDGSMAGSSIAPVKVTGGHSFISLGQAGPQQTCAIATRRQGDAEAISPTAGAPPSPAAPGLPLPAPAEASQTASTPSSSVPVGAIVGGVAAGVAVLAVLAFFALRPGRGWLRRKPEAAAAEDGPQSYKQASEAAPTEPAAAPPSNVPGAFRSSGDAQLGPQPLPHSYVSTAGLAISPAVAGAAWNVSHSSSAHSTASDPVLAFVTSHVASQPPSAQQQPSDPVLSGSSGGGSSGLELRTDVRLWEVQWAELTILRLLGRGSFGSVYLGEWNQVAVAVKVLIGKDDMASGQLQLPDRVLHELQAEAAVMSRMRHPNIVQFMGLVAVPPALITEYCSQGSLYDCLAAGREQAAAAAQLTWRRRLAMAVDAAAGLLYLHRRSIIHRDVKSPNLLVDEHFRVKVADFNLSKLLEGARPEASLTSAAATNPIWLAPEVLSGGSATAASDVYSFGLVLFELLTWRLPWTFAHMSPFKIGATVRQGGRPEVPPREALPGPDTASWAGLDAYVQLMRDCWAQRPGDRPAFDEVVGRLRRLLADTVGS